MQLKLTIFKWRLVWSLKNLGVIVCEDLGLGGHMAFNPETPYLTPNDLTEILRASLKWIYQRLNAGEIPGSFKIGGVWLIDREVFTQTLKQKAQKPQPRISKTGEKKSRHDLD